MISDEVFDFFPLNRPLFLRGHREGQAFYGMALGVGWHRAGEESFYLLSDLTHAAPIWVSEHDVTQQHWTAGGPESPARGDRAAIRAIG